MPTTLMKKLTAHASVTHAKTLKQLLTLTCLASLASLATAASKPIEFDKGQIAATYTGKLAPRQTEQRYHLYAKRGQYMTMTLAPRSDTPEFANVVEVIAPDGSYEGGKGTRIYQGCLPTTGRYQLRIARNLMVTHGGVAGYRMTVKILPPTDSRAYCE